MKGILDFYNGKRYVVLGGAGFVGTKLVGYLIDLGAHVNVIDDFSRGFREIDNPNVDYTIMDIGRSISILAEVIKRLEPDGVFNLAAAVAGVMYNMDHHSEMYHSNMRLLTTPVLACERAGVRAFLQTSSVCVYAPENNAPSIEEFGFNGTPHRANAGYAEAKRDGERVAMWSNIEHVTIVRPSNVVGDGDYFDDKAHVVPALIKRAYESMTDPFTLYGNPLAVREFIHCSDVALGMLYTMRYGRHKEAYNLGCGGKNTIGMLNLAKNVLAKTGRPNREVVVDDTLGGGDDLRFSNVSKASDHLGWEFQKTLSEMLDDAIIDYTNRYGESL